MYYKVLYGCRITKFQLFGKNYGLIIKNTLGKVKIEPWIQHFKKWNWKGHTVRKTDNTLEINHFGMNPNVMIGRTRPKTYRIVFEEIAKEGKIWRQEVTRNRTHFGNVLCSSKGGRGHSVGLKKQISLL